MAIRITGAGPGQEPQHNRETMPTPFRLFEDFFNDWAMRSALSHRRESWKPPVDIYEKDPNIIIRMEMPGISESAFDLKLDGNTLTIQGEKKPEPEDSGHIYHQVEGFYGQFRRSFDLPASADTDKISAAYNNGILTITIPQKAEARSRAIKIIKG